MRTILHCLFLIFCLSLGLPPLAACCGDDDPPSTIKFPNVSRSAVQRGDYLVFAQDQRIVVDLKQGKVHQLGKIEGRWFDIDVVDGLALTLNKERLQVRALADNKVVRDIDVGKERVHALGFIGKKKAFVHRGRSLQILELASGKTLHTIDFASDEMRWNSNGWQIVGNRLFIAGPETTLAVIDLESGKLVERISIHAGAGIASVHVEGSIVYCMGSPFSWVPNNSLVCYDMESKKTFFSKLSHADRFVGRIAGGPYGTAFIFSGNHIERITMMGERCGTFEVDAKESVLAVWRGRAVVAGKDEIRLVEIKEKQVTRASSR